MTAVEDDEWVMPFAYAAELYLERGWWPVPLPAVAKDPVPVGFTGTRGRAPTAADVRGWVNVGRFGSRPSHVIGNICVHLAPGIIGIDVDAYAKGAAVKRGDESLAELVEQWGPLPDTYSSTARGWGDSRIRFYRVPAGTRLKGAPADGIEVIQHHHRYAVVWPSVHPTTKTMYLWFDPSGEEMDGPPDLGDLPALPLKWIEGLRSIRANVDNAPLPTSEDVTAFYAEACGAARPDALKGVRKVLDDPTKPARHDRLVEAACWVAREAAAGWYPMAQAEQYLRDWWEGVMDDPERRDGTEFDDAIAWGIAQVDRSSAQFLDKVRQADEARATKATTPTEAHDGPNLPATFWEARLELAHIRQAAHARGRSADAVLGAVLARVAVLLPPTLRLPAIVGSWATLDLLVALVASSGGGKSSAAGVARDLLPIDDENVVDDLTVGSGEGLIDAFLGNVTTKDDEGKKVTERRQVKRAVLAYVDEGQVVTEMARRQGTTLLPTLRTAWSGQTLGQANASTERYRRLEAGRYRLAAIIAVQTEHAAAFIEDSAGGTPQRFLWLPANDPSIPEDAPPWPGRLRPALPDPAHFTLFCDIEVDEGVARKIRARDLRRARGAEVGADPLDSHADLQRLKVAALLGALDGRRSVTPQDWHLAGQVLETSRHVRTIIVESARSASRHREDAAIDRAVRRDVALASTAEQRALERAARAVANRVHRGGGDPVPRRDLTQSIAGRDRQLVSVDDALVEAERLTWVASGVDGWTPGKAKPT